jgi:hypothetical protein
MSLVRAEWLEKSYRVGEVEVPARRALCPVVFLMALDKLGNPVSANNGGRHMIQVIFAARLSRHHAALPAATRPVTKETQIKSFDKLRMNGNLLIPFVVGLSNHERNQINQRTA